ncbi:hypothetical protein [Nevskia sp.]|uniref:hypothetical protein n=1 Tax=Nevskia sp. TaxID=1929292 RepID=UPI0025F6E151|nr:hypothetical protein [Nevskia sp.]
MLVTLHARHTAMYRVLRQQGLSRTADRIEFHKLDRAWERRCGLRRADLLEAIAELSLAGVITQTSGSEGTVIEVTEHGSLQLQRGAHLLRGFSWSQPLASAAEALHTAVTLYRAGLRTRRFLRSSRTLVIDRRGRV